MSKPLRVEPEAADELEQAVRWYEERRVGLGSEFLDAVDVTRTLIVRWPHAGAPVPGVPPDLPVRRAPVHDFPYHIIYLETSAAIRILACAHDRRRPGYWRSRISH